MMPTLASTTRHRPRTPIPIEYIGRARALRNKIAAAATTANDLAEAMLRPLRPRDRFTPMPRHDLLKALPVAWRKLPAFGRLRLVAG
jgi:hypothetical protein